MMCCRAVAVAGGQAVTAAARGSCGSDWRLYQVRLVAAPLGLVGLAPFESSP